MSRRRTRSHDSKSGLGGHPSLYRGRAAKSKRGADRAAKKGRALRPAPSIPGPSGPLATSWDQPPQPAPPDGQPPVPATVHGKVTVPPALLMENVCVVFAGFLETML